MTTPPIGSFLFGLVVGAALAWVFVSRCRDAYWRDFNARRRGSNPSQPSRKPAPLPGPPEQPLQAQLIRYWRWKSAQVERALFDPRLKKPWEGEDTDQQRQAIDQLATQLEEDGKYLLAAGYANQCTKTRDLGVRVIRASTLLAGGLGMHRQRRTHQTPAANQATAPRWATTSPL